MVEIPSIDNPAYRESLRPMKPSAQQLRDKRYRPTAEAIYLQRTNQNPESRPVLPPEGRIRVPVIDGRPGDPNRHPPRPTKQEKKKDEFHEFQEFEGQFLELYHRIESIRSKSRDYQIYATNEPSVPPAIARKFNELNQQLFALKKCFVSPEEIMLDNTALIIQRFWRKKLNYQRFKNALISIHKYRKDVLSPVHRTLNSWMAQMEYADSRAGQFYFRNISKISKIALKHWQKWSERESIVTNRNEVKANDFFEHLFNRHVQRGLVEWKDIANGPQSRKAKQQWRLSHIPIMKRWLENRGITAPAEYVELAKLYVSTRANQRFLSNFIYKWHSQCHTKSTKKIVAERHANLFFKNRLMRNAMKIWGETTQLTKQKLGPKRAAYINLMRKQYSERMTVLLQITQSWHKITHSKAIIREMRKKQGDKLLVKTFHGWIETNKRFKKLKIDTITKWKRAIQDPKVVVFREWYMMTLRSKTKRDVLERLAESHRQWTMRRTLSITFWKWKHKYTDNINFLASKELTEKRLQFFAVRKNTENLNSDYNKEKDKISTLETKLGDITQEFVDSENKATDLDDVSTTWKIALHALKMEILRLGLIVQKCSETQPKRQRRYSDEEKNDKDELDDRYGHTIYTTKLSKMKTTNRILGNWKRRDSDPDILGTEELLYIKDPQEENLIQQMPVTE